MTVLMTNGQVHDGASDDPRMVYWLTLEQRRCVRTAIDGAFASIEVHQNLRKPLSAVLIELAVVDARDAVWPRKAALVRRVNRLPQDSLPVCMSGEEVAALLTVPGLADSVRAAIAKGSRLR